VVEKDGLDHPQPVHRVRRRTQPFAERRAVLAPQHPELHQFIPGLGQRNPEELRNMIG